MADDDAEGVLLVDAQTLVVPEDESVPELDHAALCETLNRLLGVSSEVSDEVGDFVEEEQREGVTVVEALKLANEVAVADAVTLLRPEGLAEERLVPHVAGQYAPAGQEHV